MLATFHDAVAEATSAHPKKVHALLGNGFSRACRDDIFAYGALFERADFAALSGSAREAFESLETRDFEIVIEALRQSAKLAHLYGSSEAALERMREDADGLREVLVAAIASSHPNHPHEISTEQYAACRTFLASFQRIYTLNYDLLLYWAIMHSDAGPPIRADDGFRGSPDDSTDYVVWDPASSNHDQNIFYVHGGLHLFDAGFELVKYTWSRTGVRLIDQVRSALAAEKYPLFVAEGTSDEKLARIRHHAYLGRIERSLLELTGALFVYGASFGSSDAHVLDWLSRGKISHLYVGVYGDESLPASQGLMQRAKAVTAQRRGRPLQVTFFDAISARAWG